MMDPKTQGPKTDEPKTERPPKGGGEDQAPSDIERATDRGGREFDPNVNQRPR